MQKLNSSHFLFNWFLIPLGLLMLVRSVGAPDATSNINQVVRYSQTVDFFDGPPQLIDVTGLRRPRVRARSAIVYNPETHQVLWESNGFQPQAIASITKIMMALVFLDQEPQLNRDVVVSRRDVYRANTTYLRRGERITLYDLLHLALIASDNAAARVLARVSHYGTVGFVDQMNLKASELGLESTSYADPSGLHEQNLSTAYDLSRLIVHATKKPVISTILRKQVYVLNTSRRRLTDRNTNKLLRSSFLVHGGKTGYIDAAGYCFAAVVKLPDNGPLSVVVLGAGSNSRRFSETRALIEWVSKNSDALKASDS